MILFVYRNIESFRKLLAWIVQASIQLDALGCFRRGERYIKPATAAVINARQPSTPLYDRTLAAVRKLDAINVAYRYMRVFPSI